MVGPPNAASMADWVEPVPHDVVPSVRMSQHGRGMPTDTTLPATRPERSHVPVDIGMHMMPVRRAMCQCAYNCVTDRTYKLP